MAQTIKKRETTSTKTRTRVKVMITPHPRSHETSLYQSKHICYCSGDLYRAPRSTTTTTSGQQYRETVYVSWSCHKCFSSLDPFLWKWELRSQYSIENPYCVFINPNIKPKLTSLPLFYREEGGVANDQSSRFVLSLQKLATAVCSVKPPKKSGRRNNKSFSNESGGEHILRTSTSPDSLVDGERNEKDNIALVDAFGRRTIANWKCLGRKRKEWRKTPWESTNPVHRGVPEKFLKQDSSSQNHRWFSGRKPKAREVDFHALQLAATEAVADLTNVHSQRVDDENEASWQEETNGWSLESGCIRMPRGLEDTVKSKENTAFSLPNDSYSGAIIGGHFQLSALIEEHETPGEKTYAVSDLRAPERKLVARLYSLAGLPREYRDARKRHMKRLVRRENGCDVRQDGKIYIVYTCDEMPPPSAATQFSAHDRIRPPGPSKALQDDTEFPSLSTNTSPAKQNTFWKPSKVQGFFRLRKQQAPPMRPGTAGSLVPGQVSVPKRKRHRWRKAKRHDPTEPCTAAEPKDLAVPADIDKTSGQMAIPHLEMVDPSFGCCIEMDKHLEIHAETIIAIAAQVEGCDLHAVRKSLGVGSVVNSALLTEVIDDMTRQEFKLADQTASVQAVLRFMRHHFRVQRRREEINKLIEKVEWMNEQLTEKTRLEQRLRVRLMKAKEGKAKERVKVIQAKVCKELDDIRVTLEDDFRRKTEILAGGAVL